MQNNIVTVLGGTGFVGRVLVKHLARAGYVVNVVSRTPAQAGDLRVLGPVGKVVLSRGNIRDIDSIKPYLKASFAVIDLVGIMHESGQQKFTVIHAQAAENLAKAAHAAGVEKFIFMSALGVDKASDSRYARSKLNGEKAVMAAFPGAVVVRPSIIFGMGDGFFGRFSRMAKISPALPLIDDGETKFQPVYVEDVAEAFVKILGEECPKKLYELGGPKIYSFQELLELMLAEMHKERLLLPLPFPVAKLLAFFLQLLPCPPLTLDQVRLLEYDNILSDKNGLELLGIKPHYLETELPNILAYK